jgi:hypothetical protein
VTHRRIVLELAIAVAAGWCVIALPYLGDSRGGGRGAVFLPFMADAVQRMGAGSIFLLFLLGMALGSIGELSPWVIGFAAVATLPAWSTVDAAMGGGGHNLLPFEWLAYAFFGFVASLGALAGHGLSRGSSAE